MNSCKSDSSSIFFCQGFNDLESRHGDVFSWLVIVAIYLNDEAKTIASFNCIDRIHFDIIISIFAII